MTLFGRETLAEVWDDAQPLLKAHWEEIAHYPDIALDPDRAGYEAQERAGMLRIYTLRDDGRLVGYAVYFVRRPLHYRTSLQGFQDILYLAPEYRGRLAGVRLISKADAALKEEGVEVVFQHEKLAHPQLGRVLERMGYEPMDRIWTRRL